MKEKKLYSHWVLIAATVILVPLRIIQYFTILEPQTGFYTEINALVYAFAAVMALTLFFFIFEGIKNGKRLEMVKQDKTNVGYGVACGLVMTMCSICILRHAGTCFGGDYESTVTAESQLDMEKIMMLEGILAIISAVYFFICGMMVILRKGFGEKLRVLSLVPVLWYLVRLITMFTKAISYARVSELFLNMMMVAFFAMFLMNYAAVNGSVNSEGLEKKVYGYGYCAAILAFVTFIPNACLYFTGKGEMMYADYKMGYCDFTLALFIIIVVITRLAIKDENTALQSVELKAESGKKEEAADSENGEGENTEPVEAVTLSATVTAE